MAEHLKRYQLKLITKGPVFIGDGKSLGKKEYFKKGKIVYVPDLQTMYHGLQKLRLDKKYESFLLDSAYGRMGLEQWLRQNHIDPMKNREWISYTLDAGDILETQRMEILTFIKDPYGCPYIPGSSLKGALRTALLSYELCREGERYAREKSELIHEARTSREKRKFYLKKQAEDLETKVFNRLDRLKKESEKRKAVNDVMSCLRISDSRPLSTKDLILCQKLDMFTTGKYNPINVMRECIRPEVKIEFEMTIDDRFPYTVEEILEAVKNFVIRYYNSYSIPFLKQNPELEKPRINYIWLGGGAGFVSKTVIYPMLHKKEENDKQLARKDSVDTIANILTKTVNNPEHDHEGDRSRGVSPHTLKITKCQGKMYEFGKCALKII